MVDMGIRGISTHRFHGASHFHGRREGAHPLPVGVNGPHPPVKGCFPRRKGSQVHQHLVRVNALVVVEVVFHGAVPVQIFRKPPENFHFVAHRFRVLLPGEEDELFLGPRLFFSLGRNGPLFPAGGQGTLEKQVFYISFFRKSRKGQSSGQKGGEKNS